MSRSLHTYVSFLLLLTLGAWTAAPATAQPERDFGILNTADFTKSFSRSPVGPDSVSSVFFDIFNDTGDPITDLSFTDVLPDNGAGSNLMVADPVFVTNSCGGTVTTGTDMMGQDSITLSGGLLGAGEGCQIQVDVTAPAAGTYTNSSVTLDYTRNGDGESSTSNAATLTVEANRPSFDKTFTDPVLRLGGTTTLTFTLTAGTDALSRVSFTDTLPSGLRIANPANASTTCTSSFTTVTADPGTQEISLSSQTGTGTPVLAAGASCTVSVDVTAVAVGTFVNRSEPLSANASVNNRDSGRATDDVTVVVDQLALVKEFTDDPVIPGQTVTLEFRITNLDRENTATDVTFSDDLDATLTGLAAVDTPQSDVCGAGSQLTGTSTLTLTDGTLAPGETCVFQATLQVPGGAPTGSYPNTTTDIQGTVDGMTVVGAPATDTLEVAFEPVLTKTFLTNPVGAGDTTVAEFTLTNTSPTDSATDISFTDNISAFLSGVGATPPGPNFCNGTGFAFINTVSGTQFLQVQDITLAAGASCTFQVTFQIPGGTAAGDYVNTTSSVSATVGGDMVVGDPASDTLTVVPAVQLSKSFDPGSVAPGGVTTLDFILGLPEDASGSATGITFSDDLDYSIFVSGPNPDITFSLTPADVGAFPVAACGGTLTYDAGTNVLTFTGGTLNPGETCTVSVDLQAPAMPADSRAYGRTFTNTTSTVDAQVDGLATTGVPATDTIALLPLATTKEFVDDPAVPGGQVVLRFTLENLGTEDIDNISFTDNLQTTLSGLTPVVLPPMPCGPTSSITAVGVPPNILAFQNGELAVGESCSFDVTLQVPTDAAAGDYGNTTGTVSYDLGGTGVTQPGFSDDLVIIEPLGIEKEFLDDPVAGGETVTLQFTLFNTDPDDAATGLSFTDDLNAALTGLTVAGIPNPSPCGAGSTLTGTGTTMLTFANGTVGPADSCTFQVTLQVPANPDTSSPAINTTSDLTGTVDGAAQTAPGATDELDLLVVELTKSFSSSIAAGDTVDLTFTLENTSGSESFDNLSFTDNLDAALAGLVAVGLPRADVCGSGSQLSGTSALTFSGGVLAPGATCSFTVTLQVPADAMPGTYQNVTSRVFEDGLPEGTSATAPLVVEPPPAFSKAFAPDVIGEGTNSTLTFTIDNTGSGLAATDLDFTDNLPAFVFALPPSASTTCTGGTLTVAPDGTSVSYTGGSVAAGASCTVSVDVAVEVPGSYDNVSGDLTSSLGNSGPASDTLLVEPNPAFNKFFDPSAIASGGTTTLTFTIGNSGSTDATGLDFTDNLPAGVVIATPSNASTTCTGGTLTAPAGGTTISYSGGSVAAGTSCNVFVDVTATTPGEYVNVSGELTSSLGNSGTTNAILVVNPAPGFSKMFSPDVIAGGDVSTLTFTIDNSAANRDADSLSFTDTLPTGVVVASPSNASTTCFVGTLTAVEGSDTIEYSGGIVAANEVCTVSVDVTAAGPGTYVNTSSDLTSSLGNSGPATDTLEVEPAPTFSKAFGPDVIMSGGVSTLTFTIDNSASTLAATGLDFTDVLPAGVVVAPAPNASTTCTGGTLTAGAGTDTISYTGGTVAAGSTCTVSVDVTADTPGTYDNASGDLTSSLGNSGPATDTLAVSDEILLTKSFDDPSLPGGAVELTFTVTNGLSSTVTDLSFTDDLDAALAGLASISPPQTDVCGPGSQVSGTSTVTFSGGTLGANESCTFSVTVRVPAGADEGSYLNTTSQITGNQGAAPVVGAPASDNLDVVQLDFTKTFTPSVVQAGETVTLLFTLTNPDPVRTADELSFTDDLNAFIPGATAVGLPQSDVCGTGSVLAGTSVITLTGGSLGPGETCSFSVQVMVPNTTPEGFFVNETSPLNAVVDGTPVVANAAPPAEAELSVGADILAIPTLSEWMLLLLALSLGGVGVWRMRG